MALAQIRGGLPARADRRLCRPTGHRRLDRLLQRRAAAPQPGPAAPDGLWICGTALPRCPNLHRHHNSGTICQTRFWQREQESECTLTGRPTCPANRDHLRIVRRSRAGYNDIVHAFVIVGLHTSMRHSEILALRRGNIDLDRNVIRIPRARAGAREPPITSKLAGYLAVRLTMLPPGCPWLFPSPASREGRLHTIRKAFRRLAERAGRDPDQVAPHLLPYCRHPSCSGRGRSPDGPADFKPQDAVDGGPVSAPEWLAHPSRYGEAEPSHRASGFARDSRFEPENCVLTTKCVLTSGKLRLRCYCCANMPSMLLKNMVPRGGFEPPTRGFSVRCSTN